MPVLVRYSRLIDDTPFVKFQQGLALKNIDCVLEPLDDAGEHIGIPAYLPTAIMIWISAEFFVKDTDQPDERYAVLNKAIMTLIAQTNHVSKVILNPYGKPLKNYPYSTTHSIEATDKDGIRIKLLLPVKSNERDTARAIALHLDYMKRLHADDLTSTDRKNFFAPKIIANQIIAVANLKDLALESPYMVTVF